MKKGSIIVLCLFAGLAVFVLFFYFTVKTKSTSVNNLPPFSQWINKTVKLARPVTIFEQKAPWKISYPLLLSDSMHSQWEWLQNQQTQRKPEAKLLRRIPSNAWLKIEKAIVYTNGVSGNSTPVVFGTLYHNKDSFKISYRWGEQSAMRSMNNIAASWLFDLAPWQTVKDTGFYALPKVNW